MSPRTGRPRTGAIPNINIRLDRDVYQKARIAAVTARRTMGQWLAEAILEKLQREANNVAKSNS